MSSYLFVSGMFRSGTTLFARTINTHSDIVCASDPFRPFYKSFRNAIAADVWETVENDDAPLDGYFADRRQLTVFEAIQEASLERPFSAPEATLLEQIVQHSEPYSPFIAEELEESHLSGATYREVMENLLAEVPKQYGEGTEKWIATKETWTTEFTPALARTFPNSKFVLIVRDPRAVSASKYSREDKYPWLFLARQWRKLALLAHLYANDELESRAHLIRYEDLVTRPEETAEAVCDFLDLELDRAILSPENFIDGRNEQWLQNTSYEGGSAAFNTDSVHKWKEILDERVVPYLERLCFPEMALMGYERDAVARPGFTDEAIFAPASIPRAELADWIIEYQPSEDALETALEHSIEATRHRLLQCESGMVERIEESTVKAFFLRRSLLDACRQVVHEGE